MNATSSIAETPAAPILARYQPSESTVQCASKKLNALELLDGLVAADEFESAIDFLAYWMPPQFAIWWGCLAVWELEREQETPQLQAAMKLIISWLQNPAEPERRNLVQIEQWFSTKHPVGLLGKAALFSSGSMAGPDLPVVEPPPYLFCVFVSSTVKLVAAKGKPAEYATNYKQLLRLGMEVLQGANRWEANHPSRNA